jgi:hypothetical protein
MASRVVLVDDLDGSEGAETITFTIDGTTTEIDLSKQNAANLRKALSEYQAHGRTVQATRSVAAPSRRSSTGQGSSPAHLAQVREWANNHGFTVSTRGRIPGNVMAAYEDAHK